MLKMITFYLFFDEMLLFYMKKNGFIQKTALIHAIARGFP